ncbi:hypothetical protein V8C35DRAFT_322755 [Trichoderma chlorosporum]
MRKALRKWRDKRKSSREGSVVGTSSGNVNASTPNGNVKPSAVEPDVAEIPITSAESIWNSAYDALKADEPKLVQGYEKILSLNLNQSAVSLGTANVENTIEDENVLVRRAQMSQLINDGLNKTAREMNTKSNIGPVMQVVNTTKKLVTDAIKDMPQAALPWGLVYISLSVLTHPISQTEANHTGIEYIGATIKWYWEQAALLFDGSLKDPSFIGAQNELRLAFINFYKKILQFQMRSICNYYKNRSYVFLRDLVELDDWDGSLKSLRVDDASLRNKVDAFLSLESESHLRAIAHHTKAQENYQRTQEDQQCLRDLRITDPRVDRSRIERTKGGLLQESYRWILENPQFQNWRTNDENRLLWLRGDPGKGKTMLLCGLVEELMQQSDPSPVTFFFCQATIPSINNHIAVLRGLIWLLADQHPSLISHIRKAYDTAGKAIFDEGNAWYALSDIFSNMLGDAELPPVYIIIDALDECTTGRPELLRLIRRISTSSSAKWAVSSRNWPEIEKELVEGMNLSLEVNATLVAASVNAYILHKASQISLLKQNDELKEEVCRQMREKANGTFLWVAIVFERLNSESDAYYDDASDVMAILDEMPEDLTKLYTIMLERISQLKGKGSGLCRTILAIVTLAYRPLHLNELSTLAGFQNNLKKLHQLNTLIKDCGSFLTVRENHIYFIHQSAKEYLATDLSSQPIIFRQEMEGIRYTMVLNSLNAMEQTLRENIYGLEHPSTLIDDVSPPHPNPLDHCLYSCINWVAHLCEIYHSTNDQSLLDSLIDEEEILHFLRKHILHWFEALALTRNLSTNITYVQRLNELLKSRSATEELRKLMYDAGRFMQYHIQIMESAPMQIYSSALLFSPAQSLVRTHFRSNLPWIKHVSKSVKDADWSPRLQTIENRQPENIRSSGTNLLILHSSSKNVEIWDMATGKQVHTLNHAEDVQHAVFSNDSNRVLTVAWDRIYSWDTNSGAIIQSTRIRGFNDGKLYAISNDGKYMASCKGYGMDDGDGVQIYHVAGRTKQQLPHTGAAHSMNALTWSDDSNFLAITTGNTTRVWEVSSGNEKLVLLNDDGNVRGVPSFSGDSKLIAFPAGQEIEVWDLNAEDKILTVAAESSWEVEIVEFSKDSKLIAETRYHKDNNGVSQYYVLIWEVATGLKQHELHIGSEPITTMTLSDDAQTLAVAFSENIEIYALTENTHGDSNAHDKRQIEHSPSVITFSANFELVATADKRYVAIWNTTTGDLIQAFDDVHAHRGCGLQFSRDYKSIYTSTNTGGLRKWDIASGNSVQTFPKYPTSGRMNGIAFSFDGSCFASESQAGNEILLWNLNTAESISHSMSFLEGGLKNVHLLALSLNAEYLVSAEYLASATYKSAVSKLTPYSFTVWNVQTGEELWTTKVDIEIYQGIRFCEACYLPANDHESIAISSDGSRILFTEQARHGMWILTKQGEKIRFQICCRYFDPSFDMESPSTHILTQLGRIALDNLIAKAKSLTGLETAYDYHFIAEGYGVSLDKLWITWNGKNLLWLPPDYRATTWMAISRHCIVMAARVGQPCVIRFSGPPPFVSTS